MKKSERVFGPGCFNRLLLFLGLLLSLPFFAMAVVYTAVFPIVLPFAIGFGWMFYTCYRSLFSRVVITPDFLHYAPTPPLPWRYQIKWVDVKSWEVLTWRNDEGELKFGGVLFKTFSQWRKTISAHTIGDPEQFIACLNQYIANQRIGPHENEIFGKKTCDSSEST